MLTPSSPAQLIERIFTDRIGRHFRMTFSLTLVNGEVKARLVSVEPITRVALEGSPRSETLFLPAPISAKKAATSYIPAYVPEVSPYFSSFEFLIHSQPTRAPSFI